MKLVDVSIWISLFNHLQVLFIAYQIFKTYSIYIQNI